MGTNTATPIIAYLDADKPLKVSEKIDIEIEQTYTLEAFTSRLMKGGYSGLILDIHKVMRETPQERNRIFAFASGSPVMRTKADSYGNRIFIDSPEIFMECCNGCCRTNVREEERVEIDIPAGISLESDPAMAGIKEANLKNISREGCFIATDEDLSDEHFLNIRIETLSNRLPILAGIRWRTDENHTFQGVGVRFIKIQDDQREEIEKLYLA